MSQIRLKRYKIGWKLEIRKKMIRDDQMIQSWEWKQKTNFNYEKALFSSKALFPYKHSRQNTPNALQKLPKPGKTVIKCRKKIVKFTNQLHLFVPSVFELAYKFFASESIVSALKWPKQSCDSWFRLIKKNVIAVV